MIDNRLQGLRQQQAVHDLDWVALVPGANLRYLTGLNLTLTERPFVFFFPRGCTGYPSGCGDLDYLPTGSIKG